MSVQGKLLIESLFMQVQELAMHGLVFATHSTKMTLTRITTIANQMMTVTVNVLCSTMNLISLNPRNISELKEIQILDVLDRSNISHALFLTVVEKSFQVKMFGLFLSYCTLYVLYHILSCPTGFLDLENVCLDTKIMCLG